MRYSPSFSSSQASFSPATQANVHDELLPSRHACRWSFAASWHASSTSSYEHAASQDPTSCFEEDVSIGDPITTENGGRTYARRGEKAGVRARVRWVMVTRGRVPGVGRGEG